MCETRFYVCKHCGNLVGLIHDAGVPLVCCGEKMALLTPNTTDAATEKHVPVATVADGKVSVTVGSVPHPMVAEHFIEWIYLQTDKGGHRKCLAPDTAPQVEFAFVDETPVAVYAYCNLHGLWKIEL